ncbi:MFS transporter [Portibacter lacus]|uniref:Tetracycline resistance MFS efflux pump n=1 Tax=Portibacter lacus TaxID=1099794 RepID=A0AA37SPW2_9BACT|nr:MFS transporter [Portibacter lacus]GLR17034.1 tetracycline resistance MFS efflux pump [Portibacter lacus]
MEKKTSNLLLLTIFITVFIDLLGVGIIIPVLPSVFYADGAAFGIGTSESSVALYYGLLLACYPGMQLLGAPILGTLSDKYGRKPILTIALIGTLIGYSLFAYAIVIKSLPLLFFARLLPGFTGGNISIVMSAISDISTDDARTRNFGLVGLAFAVGFILGPTIGGVMADNTVVSWFNHSVPFIFTAGLTLVNIILVQFIFKETLKVKKQGKVNVLAGVFNIVKSFKIPNLRGIFSVVLLFSIGFTFYTQYFSVYLIEEFGWSEKEIGFLYGWVGIWLAITQGLIVRKLSFKYKPKFLLFRSMPIVALGVCLLLLPTVGWVFYLINPIIAIGIGITSPNLTTVVSEQAGPEQQGEILGINQSMQSLGNLIPAIIGGILASMGTIFPLIASGLFVIIAWLVYMKLFSADRKA